MSEDQLTGNVRHRITRWQRKCILQVEYAVEEWFDDGDRWNGPDMRLRTGKRWRDATPEDLQRKELLD